MSRDVRSVVFGALVIAALASRWLCLAGFVLGLLRLFDLVPVPWGLSLTLLFSPVIVVLIYALIGLRDENAGDE